MNSFFRELKQRKVYRVALGYAVVAWLVIQISATVMPAYHAPEWILPVFITVIALGFPVALARGVGKLSRSNYCAFKCRIIRHNSR